MILPRLNGKLTRNRRKIAAKVNHLKNIPGFRPAAAEMAKEGNHLKNIPGFRPAAAEMAKEGNEEPTRPPEVEKEEWMLSHLTWFRSEWTAMWSDYYGDVEKRSEYTLSSYSMFCYVYIQSSVLVLVLV
jgi:hypothetical protein